MDRNVRLAICEDDRRYRAGLEQVFTRTPGFAVTATYDSAFEAVAHADHAAGEGQPAPWDLVLMDIEMPRMNGIDGVAGLKATFPGISIVMLTVFEDPRTILSAICAGADGYLLKKSSVRELIEQTRAVVGGGSTLTAGVARTVLTLVRELGGDSLAGSFGGDRFQLTDRERDVLRCLVNGCSYKQVGAELEIKLDTVRAHIRKLYRKLQVHSVAEAVALAIRDGLV